MDEVTPQQMQERVGEEIGVSEWVVVDQANIDAFAEATGDHQFIHVDPVRAARSPFGTTVAHGFLTLSLFPRLYAASTAPKVAGVKMGVNYGGERVRFLTPVPSGSHVRGRFRLLKLEEKRPGQWQQEVEYTAEIQGQDKPALIAHWISQFFV